MRGTRAGCWMEGWGARLAQYALMVDFGSAIDQGRWQIETDIATLAAI